MIRHIVMWHVKGDTAEERTQVREQFRQAFEGLRGRIPGLLRLEVGLDAGIDADACDVLLLTEFADQASLQAYGSHREHLRVRDALQNLRVSRHQIDCFVA
ncbi:MAG: Dabb family protein [Pseudomonadota bacterium]